MSTDVWNHTPKPPSKGMLIAATLECCMLATFAYNRSVVGVVLWAAYAWFSATWALFSGKT